MCVFRVSLQLLSDTFFILRIIERDMIKNVYWLHVKYPLFLSDFNETWIFSTVFLKILKCQISWKSIQWEPSCSMRTDRRTDMTKLIVLFRNFVNAPTNTYIHPHSRFRFEDPYVRTVLEGTALVAAVLTDPLSVKPNALMQGLTVTFVA